jgi:N-methylhydantoinase A/oxoprolinase/acetone carboxylase beta subunit
MYNVAVDVGGTFTDVLVFDEETGGLTEGKVLSTPEDPSKGVVEGIEAVCEKVGISLPDLHLFFHGTTVVTNMILTNTGSRVGLLTTKGHAQILHLARAWIPGPLYGWMALQKPDPPADPTGGRGDHRDRQREHARRPVVPSEAVGDRNEQAHQANLHDIDAKYGDVVSVRETLDYLEEVAAAHAR